MPATSNGNAPKPIPLTQTPLTAMEAERALIGSCLILSDALAQVDRIVNERDLFDDGHRRLWSAMVTAQERYGVGQWDYLTVCNLVDDRTLWALGADAAADTPTAIHARHYANLVAEAAMRRRAVREAERILSSAYSVDESADDVAAIVSAAPERVQLPTPTSDNISPLERATMAIQGIERRQSGDTGAISFGLRDLDEHTAGGARPGQLIVVGGRTAAGKSSLMRHFARSFAAVGPVLFASNEMSAEQLADRDISVVSRIPLPRITAGTLTDDEWQGVVDAAAVIGDVPLYDHVDGAMTTASLAATVRDHWRTEPCVAIVVDYLQRMADPKGRGSDAERVEAMARALKSLAMEYRVPVIVGSQLNRDPEHRATKQPDLSDLRQSGGIEQEADIVLLIHRVDQAKRAKTDTIRPPQVIIAKQRQGPSGVVVKLAWRGAIATFGDLEDYHDDN